MQQSSFFRRRLSIDQLTEEAEADLANNNDPNNNSSNNEENQIDQHLQHEQQQHQQQQHQQQQEESQRQLNDDSKPILDRFRLQYKANYIDDDESDEDDDVGPLRFPTPPSNVDLEPDIKLILKLMPDKEYDEVRFMLEAHQNDPSRVQVKWIL